MARKIDVGFNNEGFEKFLKEAGIMFLSVPFGACIRYTMMIEGAEQVKAINKFVNNYC